MKKWGGMLLTVLLVGCQTISATAQPTTRPLTPTPAPPTLTPQPSSTPTPTPSPTPRPCPSTVPELQYKLPDNPAYQNTIRSIEDFLNQGGNPVRLAFHDDAGFLELEVQAEDLNGDGVPEALVIETYGPYKHFYLFSCLGGQYQERFGHYEAELGEKLEIMAVRDLNKDGFLEVAVKVLGCLRLRCGGVFIVAWDGHEFSHLVQGDSVLRRQLDYAKLSDPQDVKFEDVTGDGIPELVWIGGVPPKDSADFANEWPLRLETHVYRWDGTRYSAEVVEFSDPEYRFQAVQDGDRHALGQQFERAIELYQETVDNDDLDWWSADRWEYLRSKYPYFVTKYGSGTPYPPPTPDPTERPMLSAYAYFRILLSDVMRGKPEDAQSVYDIMVSTYPTGNPGHPFVEMATAFWTHYQSSGSVASACAQAVAYAANHEAILEPLRAYDFGGYQNIHYEPADVCPFK
jgi:hypothetical protein